MAQISFFQKLSNNKIRITHDGQAGEELVTKDHYLLLRECQKDHYWVERISEDIAERFIGQDGFTFQVGQDKKKQA